MNLARQSTPVRAVLRVLAVVAIMIQAMLLFGFFLMGIGWAGFWWYASITEAAAGLLVTIVAHAKKPLAALPVPFVSLGLTLLFFNLDGFIATKVCSPTIIEAANGLGPIPGFTERPEFMTELGKGCVARFNSPRPSAEVIERYRAAGLRNGWTLATSQPEGHAVLHKGTLTIDVWVNTRDDRGMYVMRVFHA